jgi:hypothetical protein
VVGSKPPPTTSSEYPPPTNLLLQNPCDLFRYLKCKVKPSGLKSVEQVMAALAACNVDLEDEPEADGVVTKRKTITELRKLLPRDAQGFVLYPAADTEKATADAVEDENDENYDEFQSPLDDFENLGRDISRIQVEDEYSEDLNDDMDLEHTDRETMATQSDDTETREERQGTQREEEDSKEEEEEEEEEEGADSISWWKKVGVYTGVL